MTTDSPSVAVRSRHLAIPMAESLRHPLPRLSGSRHCGSRTSSVTRYRDVVPPPRTPGRCDKVMSQRIRKLFPLAGRHEERALVAASPASSSLMTGFTSISSRCAHSATCSATATGLSVSHNNHPIRDPGACQRPIASTLSGIGAPSSRNASAAAVQFSVGIDQHSLYCVSFLRLTLDYPYNPPVRAGRERIVGDLSVSHFPPRVIVGENVRLQHEFDARSRPQMHTICGR